MTNLKWNCYRLTLLHIFLCAPVFANDGSGVGNFIEACNPVGNQKALVIAVDFPDSTNSLPSISSMQSRYFGSTNSLVDYWDEMSYGQTQLTGEVVGPFMLNLEGSAACNGITVANAALDAAADSVDLTGFNRIIIQQTTPACDDGRSRGTYSCSSYQTRDGTVLASIAWNRSLGTSTVFHEAGHNLGLSHATSADFGDVESVGDIGEKGVYAEYGDMFDVMGGFVSFVPVHHNAIYKNYLGILPDANVTEVSDDGTFTLEPIAKPLSVKTKALKIFRGGFVQTEDVGFGLTIQYLAYEHIWIETRSDEGYDSFIDSKVGAEAAASAYGGAIIRLNRLRDTTFGLSSRPKSTLLDMHPGTDTGRRDFLDAPLLAGESFVDPYSGITITHDGVDAVSGEITVSISYDMSSPFADTDSDGLKNFFETQIGTDPENSDTDGDGVSDFHEVCFDLDCNVYAPGTNDMNALVQDTDSDGMPDGWEFSYSYHLAKTSIFLNIFLDPLVDDAAVDTDSDGLTNIIEYTLDTNPLKADTDSDGLRDGDEVNIYNTNPHVPDTDGDGIPDGWEANNGLDPNNGADAGLDTDSDGLINVEEYQNQTLPDNPDSDNDGLDDGYEINTSFTLPLVADTDGDGLSDGYEVNTSGTNPLLKDTDGDGYDDKYELDRLSDPVDPLSIPFPQDGDMNTDGKIDISDIIIFERILLGLQTPTFEQERRGDLYPALLPDHNLTISDLIKLQNMVIN